MTYQDRRQCVVCDEFFVLYATATGHHCDEARIRSIESHRHSHNELGRQQSRSFATRLAEADWLVDPERDGIA